MYGARQGVFRSDTGSIQAGLGLNSRRSGAASLRITIYLSYGIDYDPPESGYGLGFVSVVPHG